MVDAYRKSHIVSMYTFCPLVVGLSATYNNQHILKHGMPCMHPWVLVFIYSILSFIVWDLFFFTISLRKVPMYDEALNACWDIALPLTCYSSLIRGPFCIPTSGGKGGVGKCAGLCMGSRILASHLFASPRLPYLFPLISALKRAWNVKN